ncbi:unnamed protein product [Calicophoron daubneyi]|uniref:CARD domain-containing protein n=1 Tax=Calicophoron daubneyi TaxID=300641 RepID=A0AAV2TA35_CALDB
MESPELYALRVCGPMLIQNLNALSVADYLYAKSLINDYEFGLLRAEKTSQDRSRKLLDMIRTRCPPAFKCLIESLEDEGSYLAEEIMKHYHEPAPSRRRDHSLSDLREALVEGAVPDLPPYFLNRPKLVEALASNLRSISDRLRLSNGPVKRLADLTISPQTANGNLPKFSSVPNQYEVADHPPPTNAWVLVHGMAGSGKSVLCKSVLRQNPDLLSDYFPAGVVWLTVGSLTDFNGVSNEPNSERNHKAMENGLISIIDRLECRISSLTRAFQSDAVYQCSGSPLSRNPIGGNFLGPTPFLHGSLENLRRSLIRRQQRTTWGPDEGGHLISSPLLIVLDDVCDVKVGEVLSNMPAAFLVTSRDSDVLQRVETAVDKFHLCEDFSDGEAAFLLHRWTDFPTPNFLPSINSEGNYENSDLSLACHLTYGSPLAISLLGSLLSGYRHRLSHYICDPYGVGSEFLDWYAISQPIPYKDRSLCASLKRSLGALSSESQSRFKRLVIFDANVVLSSKVAAILWGISEERAEFELTQFARFSLLFQRWVPSAGFYGFLIHPLILDFLKASIDLVRQASYHTEFVDNYRQHCLGRWGRLVMSGDHVYFWHQATTHLFRAGTLDKLADLLIDLEFLRGRLAVVGTSPVIADFRRYRAVFASLDRMDDWHAYLRFLQTNAYYVIDPVSVQSPDRSRSPYRTTSPAGSCWSLDSSPPRIRPDSGDSKFNTHRGSLVAQSSSGPKGLDLIQLGLGLPQNSPVFKQALDLLLHRYRAENEKAAAGAVSHGLSEYYWFWCNSHVAASQLVWAIPTGPQCINCLATEVTCDPDHAPHQLQTPLPSGQVTGPYTRENKPGFRKRYLAATKDGRVLLLDAQSGYEVAVQQVYDNTEVKFLCFLSNNTECLTCGGDGSLVVSTLPPAEPLDQVHSVDEMHSSGGQSSQSADQFRFPTDNNGDYMGGIDVDESDENDPSRYGTLKTRQTESNVNSDVFWGTDGVFVDGRDLQPPVSSWRRRSSAASPILNSPHVPTPIVLADLPRLTEIARVEGGLTVPDSSDTHKSPDKVNGAGYSLTCVAASPTLDALILGGEGKLDLTLHRTDGPAEQPVSSVPSLPSVYYIKREDELLYLDCSRELRLPPLSPNCPYMLMTSRGPCQTVLAAVSNDSQMVAVALSNGYLWIYSLQEVIWIDCISTQMALDTTNTVRAGPSASNHPPVVGVDEKAVAMIPGPVPSCCLFLPAVESTANSHCPTLFAAAVSNFVFVWMVPDAVPIDDCTLADPRSVLVHSKPSLSLTCSSAYLILTMDACVVAGQRILAAGTTNGRVLFWRICDGCKLLELSAHATWVTAIRLLPPAPQNDQNGPVFLNLTNFPVSVLSASADGLIKRWDVGSACLPSPTTPTSATSPWPNECPPPFPPTNPPTGQTKPDNPPGLHGLWTDVFSVWFGPHGTLLVVGRRRHSADVQFMFRPQQQTNDGKIHPEGAFTFQEVSIKPSKPFYWRPQQRPVVLLRPSDLSILNQNNSLPTVSSPPATTCSETTQHPDAQTPVNSTHHSVASNRHWVVTTGLPQFITGRATAVRFWPCGRWVAIGYSTGSIQVFSLHFDETHLFGVVKRYSLIGQNESQDNGSPGSACHDKCPDRVLHLHTWDSSPSVCSKDESIQPKSLVVLAVFASGTVKFWSIPSAVHDVRTFSSGCVAVKPSCTWPPMHQLSNGCPTPRHRRESDIQSQILCDTDTMNIPAPVTWSTLRFLPPPSSDTNVYSSQPLHPMHCERSPILVWLTAGQDGRVFGRQLLLSKAKSVICSGETVGPTRRSSRESPPWRLDLVAHISATITDADVDPTGQWLITGSTDRMAKVWCLSSGTLVFETPKHSTCVRSVCFRPVVDGPDGDWFVATGDDGGTLRIWKLPASLLRNPEIRQPNQNYSIRALSPDSHLSAGNLLKMRADDRTSSLNDVSPESSLGNQYRRFPSPDAKSYGVGVPHRSPEFFSTAAGCGGSWLRRLVWSPDGRLLTGVSDRLCVWPFDVAAPPSLRTPAPSLLSSPLSRAFDGRRSRTPKATRLALHRCRVLRVLSSGVSDDVGSSLSILAVGPRRKCLPITNDTVQLPPLLTDLPPTIVTVDTNTGTLYIFDPIGALFQSKVFES